MQYSTMGGSMKVHQFARGFGEHEHTSFTLGCKRLRPLAPKLPNNIHSSFDVKSFIRRETGTRKLSLISDDRRESVAETHPGGTRWNPTQEQIGILEMLYKGGMRTPNAQQIEKIASQLAKYGKIEGKNVFYWFQNHKARERQKQKRSSLGLTTCSRSNSSSTSASTVTAINVVDFRVETEAEAEAEAGEDSPYKRKCKIWALDQCMDNGIYDVLCRPEESSSDQTLELFPLRPEGRS